MQQTAGSGVHMANGYDPARSVALDPTTADLIRRRDRSLGPSYRLFYDEPIAVASASGLVLTGMDGRTYLDAYNNVPAIGHSHPAVASAVDRQLRTLNTHTRYLTEPILEYSERLLAKFPAPLERITYTCTGSEAIDLAVRIARHRTGKRGLIISEHAYHGTTVTAAGMSPSLGPNNPLGADVVTIPSIDTARTPAADIADRLASSIRSAIDELNERGAGVAALVLDSIFSSDGVQASPAGFLQPAAAIIRDVDALWIADEVQPGFGRTGNWWGFQRHGITPDLVVLGKPMGNGLPIAAVVGSLDVQAGFGAEVRYFNTFGGNPVCIAAATAVLDVIEKDGLVEHAAVVGDQLLTGLNALVDRHDHAFHARGAGLFGALDLGTEDRPDPALASRVVNSMRRAGVLISASGPDAASLKIRPPLPVTDTQCALILETLDAALADEEKTTS
ncbi:aspartate aminotransferase family protein [Saccharopolyspora sp. NPDC050389]|uniref:aspartate aminotransferase family protein n=1 Tax=Saccharopolyspora sp. NPDC050389 TaxID=3155516 RepID=UPI0033D6057B